jgi:hypothetical protein
MTPLGIEPATCQFVAWCLNHYAAVRPHVVSKSVFLYDVITGGISWTKSQLNAIKMWLVDQSTV